MITINFLFLFSHICPLTGNVQIAAKLFGALAANNCFSSATWMLGNTMPTHRLYVIEPD
jgi:hypothetical protein